MFRIKSGLKQAARKLQIAGVLAVTLMGMSTMALAPKVAAAAPSFGGPFNCDANSVMWCGAKNTTTIKDNYDHGDGHNSAASIQHIYSAFGISSSDINSIGTTAVAGSVTKSGDVYVGSTLVATNAWSAGREDIAGSTKYTVDGTTFYERIPKYSFLSNSISAYVVMQNGQFKFALLSACGNPIKATPKVNKSELACTALLTTPVTLDSNGDQVVTFTGKASATNATISKYLFNLGSGHGTQTINTSATSATTTKQTYAPGTYDITVAVSGVAKGVNTTAPETATCTTKLTVNQKPAPTCTAPNGQKYPQGSPNCNTCQYNNELSATSAQCVPPKTPTPPTTPTATVLPNTGAGNVIGLFLGASIFGGLGYSYFAKRRLSRR